MINFLSSWVKNLCLALIVVSILEMLLPNNKTKKYVKMVMGLYILFSIIAPFVENSSELKFDIEDLYEKYSTETSTISESTDQTSMDNRLNELYKEKLEKDIVQKLDEEGYIVEECNVKAHISNDDNGIELITLKIKEKKSVNDANNENKIDLEDKIVNEIQKIQKVEIDLSNDNDNYQEDTNIGKQEDENNITKTDIKVIKQFLTKEYGVSEKCLKIS